MIYINQIGQCEMGRGETLDAAIADAAQWGFTVDRAELREWRPGWPVMDGAAVWVGEPQEGYNT